MSQPSPYSRKFGFETYQTSHPSTPLPGDKVDIEFDAVSNTLSQVLNRISLIQRDDLELQNESVGYDQLAPELRSGFVTPVVWMSGVMYAVGKTVYIGSKMYVAVVAHVATVFATDLAAGKWQEIADFNAVTGATQDAEQSAIEAAASADAAAASAATAAEVSANAASAAGIASAAATAALADREAADASASAADSSADLARLWATQDEDVAVVPGEYSARNWAIKAQLAAASVSFPPEAIGGAYLRQLENETGLEYRTPSEVRADIGALQASDIADKLDVADVGVSVQAYSANLDELAAVNLGAVCVQLTADQLAATTIHASRDVIMVTGKAANGDDNDGEAIMLVRSPSATVGYLPDVAATKFAYLSRTIKLGKMFHGAITDGSGDNAPAISAAMDEIIAKGGGEIILPDGMYQSSGPGASKLVNVPLTITHRPGAVIKGASGFTSALLRIHGASGTGRYDGRVTLNAPRYDCSLGAYTGNQPSAIEPTNFRDFIVNDCDLYGGELYTDDGVGGDSGISPINIFNFQVRGGRIKGFLDNGIYAGGGNDPSGVDDGASYLIDGVMFDHCNGGTISKRAGYLLVVTNCQFYDCFIPIVTADVGVGQEVDTGQRMQITGNYIKRFGARAIEYRGQTKGLIANNYIEDGGFTEVGAGTVTSLGADIPFIFMNGGRNVHIVDNHMSMVDQAINTQVGIKVGNYTDGDAVAWTGGGLSGGNNNFLNIPQPFKEVISSVSPSRLLNNMVRGTFTSPFTSMVQNSNFEYSVIGTDLRYQQRRSTAGLGVATRYVDTGGWAAG